MLNILPLPATYTFLAIILTLAVGRVIHQQYNVYHSKNNVGTHFILRHFLSFLLQRQKKERKKNSTMKTTPPDSAVSSVTRYLVVTAASVAVTQPNRFRIENDYFQVKK